MVGGQGIRRSLHELVAERGTPNKPPIRTGPHRAPAAPPAGCAIAPHPSARTRTACILADRPQSRPSRRIKALPIALTRRSPQTIGCVPTAYPLSSEAFSFTPRGRRRIPQIDGGAVGAAGSERFRSHRRALLVNDRARPQRPMPCPQDLWFRLRGGRLTRLVPRRADGWSDAGSSGEPEILWRETAPTQRFAASAGSERPAASRASGLPPDDQSAGRARVTGAPKRLEEPAPSCAHISSKSHPYRLSHRSDTPRQGRLRQGTSRPRTNNRGHSGAPPYGRHPRPLAPAATPRRSGPARVRGARQTPKKRAGEHSPAGPDPLFPRFRRGLTPGAGARWSRRHRPDVAGSSGSEWPSRADWRARSRSPGSASCR